MFTTLKHWLRPSKRTSQPRTRRFGTPIEALEDRSVPDATPFSLFNNSGNYRQDWQTPFNAWTDASVTGIEGFSGQGLTSTPGINPGGIGGTGGSTTLTTGLTDPSAAAPTPGGFGEFALSGSDRFVAFAGDPGTNNAPYLLIHLDTRKTGDVTVSYTLRDEDKNANRNSVSQVALQFRVSPNGNFAGIGFTNVPAAFKADATSGSNTPTNVIATLPNAVNNQQFVQVRIITSNSAAPGGGETQDEWVGVDDILVHGNLQPVISINSTTLDYIENTPVAFIDSGMGMTDDSNDLNNGVLIVGYTGVPTADDRLFVNNQPIAQGNITTTGSVAAGFTIKYTDSSGTTTIGTSNPNGGVGNLAPLIITFSASGVTQTAVIALLRDLAYNNVSDDPVGSTMIPRTIVITLNDGHDSSTPPLTSAPATRVLNVIPVNDAPIVTVGLLPNIMEQAAPVNISPSTTIIDPDSHDYAGGTLTVSIPVGSTIFDQITIENQGFGNLQVGVIPALSQVTFSGVVVGTYSGGLAGTPLVITFNAATHETAKLQGSTIITSIEYVARAIQFANTSDNPTNKGRVIRFVAYDGTADPLDVQQGISTPADVLVTIDPINDAPVLTPARSGFSYTENGAALPIDAGLALMDPDSPDFNNGVLTADLGATATVDDRLTVRSGFGNVSVAGSNVFFDFGSGPVVVGSIQSSGIGLTNLQVKFAAAATQAAVLAVVQNISFSNVSDNPVVAPRTITMTVTDGDGGTSNVVTWTPIDVVAVNDPPTIGNVSGTVNYTAGFPALIVAPTATVGDPDSPNFNTGNFTVAITTGGTAADVVAIRNQGTGAGRIGLNGNNVTYGGVVIGTFTGGTPGASLVVTFNANSTPAIAQALADSITFRTPNGIGVTGVRTLSFSALDFVGGAPSNAPTLNVNVTSTAGPNDDFYETNEDTSLSISAANGVLVNDPNGAQSGVNLQPTKGSVNLAADGSFQYFPNANFNGTDTFTYHWTNTSTNAISTAVVTIVIDAVNDPPTVNNVTPAVFAATHVDVNEDSGSSSLANFAIVGPGGGADEASQTVTRTVSNNNNAMFSVQPAIDPTTGQLTFTPAPNANGTAIVSIALQDSGGTFNNTLDQDSATYTFTINVAAVNDQPTFQITSTTISALEDSGPNTVSNFAFNFVPGPANESTQTATYILTPSTTSGGLTFSAAPAISPAGDLTFTSAPFSNGTAKFILQVRDSGGTLHNGVDTSVGKTFTITIGAVNDPPTVVDDSATVIWNSDPNTIPVLANDSGLPDIGDTVAVSAVTQPAHGTVVVQPGGGGVTYQPTPGYVGADSFTYTDIDSTGLTATATVTLNVIRYQTQPVDIVAIGAGPGAGSAVRLYNTKTGQFVGGFSAYAPEFQGGVSVAMGDVNGDGVADVIVAAGPGGGPHIQVVDGNRLGLLLGVDQIAPPSSMLGNFFGYDFAFRGGVTVAVGDVNGDGKADIILGTGPGGAAHVKIISGAQIGNIGPDFQPNAGAILASFFAFDSSFRGGVQVATGDVNRDGYFDVVATAGPGGASHVKAFSGRKLVEGGINSQGVLLASFYAFDPNFRGGANIAVGDFNGDGYDDFIVGAGAGGGSHVKVFSPFNLATPIASFFAFEPAVTTGVSVGYRMRSGGSTPLLLAGTKSGTASRVTTFAPPNFTTAGTIDVFDPSFLGGVDLG